MSKPADEAAGGWGSADGSTTLILVRHGVTPHTQEKRFSGGMASANPSLAAEGRHQVTLTAQWMRPHLHDASAVIASPVQRTTETGEILAAELGLPLEFEAGFAEMEFGRWDGLTYAEVGEQFPDELAGWFGNLEAAPLGGESFREVQQRVLGGLARIRTAYAGRTVVIASHVTPIKTIVATALGAPLESVFRMELAPAAVCVVAFDATAPQPGDTGWVKMVNALPPERTGTESGRW